MRIVYGRIIFSYRFKRLFRTLYCGKAEKSGKGSSSWVKAAGG